jgi:signal transduction histidine kinase/CheY-like chemotaxis protein/HPt (histidine-containing phosphotransfer) domain-containing protein
MLFFASAGMLLLVALLFSYYIDKMEKTAEESIQHHLLVAAQYAAVYLTAEELDLFHEAEDMERPEWDEIRLRLQDFAEKNEVLYVYYWRHIGDGYFQYIIDNDEDEEWMVTPEDIFSIADDPTTADAAASFMSGVSWTSDLGSYTSSWDGLISGAAPVYAADGTVYAAAGVDLGDEVVITIRNNIRTMRIFLVLSFAISIMAGLLGMRSYNKKAIQSAKANLSKSQFLSTMSHEIRTPMNAILGVTEIQLQNDTIDANVREGFEKIFTSGDMLLSIINDILDLSKIEAGKLELLIENYDVASLINDTAQINVTRIGSKPIKFHIKVDENLPAQMAGDELRIKQVTNNILSNAFKYTSEGEVTLRVFGEDETDESITMVIAVSDTGQGMSKEQVAKLFEEYSQFNMEANRSIEGTGLGLSITYNLISLMNGTISVESEKGKGSTFTIRLPQVKLNGDILGKDVADNLSDFRARKRSEMKRAQIKRDPMPYGSILVVDDVETNRYVALGLMAPYELSLDSADSGFVAIDKVKRGNKYDIIFMDHMMPEMDGVEATKILRDMGYTEPIVALTANVVAGQAEIFLNNGFDDFISKPIDIRHLNAVLNKWIRDKQPPEVVAEARKQAELRLENIANTTASDEDEVGVMDANVVESFVRDAQKSLKALEAVFDVERPLNEAEVRTYIIHTHGMKSALANIGNISLSDTAGKLEDSARDGDFDTVMKESKPFISALRAYLEEVKPPEDEEDVDCSDEDLTLLNEKLNIIKAACVEYDGNAAEMTLNELRQRSWPKQIKDMLTMINEYLLHSNFDEAVTTIDNYVNHQG